MVTSDYLFPNYAYHALNTFFTKQLKESYGLDSFRTGHTIISLLALRQIVGPHTWNEVRNKAVHRSGIATVLSNIVRQTEEILPELNKVFTHTLLTDIANFQGWFYAWIIESEMLSPGNKP